MGSEVNFKKLGDLAKIKGGKRMPKGESLTTEENSHPYIRVRDMNEGFIYEDNLEYVPDKIFPQIDRYTVEEGNVIISIVGTIGLVVSIPKSLDGANLTENAAKILIKDENLDPEYLEYFLRSRIGQHEIRKNTVGSTQLKLPLYGIKNIDVPLPPMQEQKKVAKILRSLDDKIKINKRINETLETIARAVFKSWFVDFDPVRAKMAGEPYPLPDEVIALFPDALVESELGMIPKGWEDGTIGNIAANKTEVVHPDEVDENTLYIGLEHMPRRSIALDSWEYANKVTSNKYIFSNENILFGKLRPYFHKVGISPINGICSTDILVINGKERLYLYFLLFLLSSKIFIDSVSAASTGTKMPRTNWSFMKSYGIPLPPKIILEKFNYLITPMNDNIILNIHTSHNLLKTRNMLLSKLMSGEIGV
jgi:type I restriction enzyme, S subunit